MDKRLEPPMLSVGDGHQRLFMFGGTNDKSMAKPQAIFEYHFDEDRWEEKAATLPVGPEFKGMAAAEV